MSRFGTKCFWADMALKQYGDKRPITDRSHVDIEDFPVNINQIYSEFNAEGLDVVNVIPATFGVLADGARDDSHYAITRGAVVVGKKR